jgi:hypothetical protein
MKRQTKYTLLFITLVSFITLSSFSIREKSNPGPKTITKTILKNTAGQEIIKTQIVLDGNTSREDLIAACSSLGKERVQLTFDQVTIRKNFMGIWGKSRIAYAKGKIELPNRANEPFEAGGAFNFKFIKITYSQVSHTDEYTVDMIEIVD